jgi:alpha/beta superfamily hydrolase
MFENDYLKDCHKPKLIIQGTNDELAPYDLAVHWFEQLPAPKSMIAIEGADHFFQGHLDEVQAIITSFVHNFVM